MNQLMFVRYMAMAADSGEKLHKQVTEFGGVGKRRKFRVNLNKSKVRRYSKGVI